MQSDRIPASRPAPTKGPHRARRLALCVILLAGASATLLASTSFSARPEAATATRPPAVGSFPGGRYFNVFCGFSHRNNDDPIVFPDAPGRSHNHTFIGNRNVDASTKPGSLLDGETTCDVQADASTYWFPTLYDGVDALPPLAVLIYYTRHTTEPVVALPVGLKMIAGNATARRPQPKGIVSWSCGGGGGQRFTTVPSCSEESALVLNVRFPNCWNGKSLDSADHKRHMAYSSLGACPASHHVRLPTIALVLIYSPTSRYARVSSGKFAAHADFMNGWDQQVLTRLVGSLNH
jgi:hypothetical protein